MDILIITVLIIAAVILFLVELFVIPGISLAGISALACILYANYYHFRDIGCRLYRLAYLVHAFEDAG